MYNTLYFSTHSNYLFLTAVRWCITVLLICITLKKSNDKHFYIQFSCASWPSVCLMDTFSFSLTCMRFFVGPFGGYLLSKLPLNMIGYLFFPLINNSLFWCAEAFTFDVVPFIHFASFIPLHHQKVCTSPEGYGGFHSDTCFSLPVTSSVWNIPVSLQLFPNFQVCELPQSFCTPKSRTHG